MDSPAALAFHRVSMAFPGVKALQDVSFDVHAGSVHALMGENGAGKSTLLKILSGALTPSEGTLALVGTERTFRNAADALAAGIAVIYQEPHLVPDLSVAENIFLGHLPRRFGLFRRGALGEAVRRQLESLGESIDPWTKVRALPPAQRQMVEIAKALTRGARIIAFDEPTSSLSEREARRLFAIIRELKQRGCAIIYVSHRMSEVFELCDRVTILRDGRHVETNDLCKLTRDAVVQRMIGRDLVAARNTRASTRSGGEFEVEDLLGPGLTEPCSLRVSRGEIVGIFGLAGAGRSELLHLIYGEAKKISGRVLLGGKDIVIESPRDAIESGIVLCPEDRAKQGIVAMRSVLENINLSARRLHARGGFLINAAWEVSNARQRIDQLRIKTPSQHAAIRNLSGGNQQKAILGRWLSETVKVILLDEPTRGIDIGAKAEIQRLIQDLAERGACVILVSSELPEILAVAIRIAVMQTGRIATVVDHAEATEENILQHALPVETAKAS